jgi:hypothetical protein
MDGLNLWHVIARRLLGRRGNPSFLRKWIASLSLAMTAQRLLPHLHQLMRIAHHVRNEREQGGFILGAN